MPAITDDAGAVDTPMRYRALGRSGIKVSEIGFGAWGIGGATPGATSYGRTDDRVSLRTLDEAVSRGITFFDTSSVYGYGHSEELLGKAFAKRRDRVVIATKAGLERYGEPADFSPERIRSSLSGSLRRLRMNYVDLLQLHNPSTERLRSGDDIGDIADRLKREGLIRAFGISVRDPQDGLVALERLRPDAIQANFNLLDQRMLECGLLDAAHAAGCAIIARTPLCFGFLSDRVSEHTSFPSDDHRSRWSREQIAWWAEGGRLMRAHMTGDLPQSASQFALRFCLSFPAVTSVIPGMLTPEEVAENAGASPLGRLSDKLIADIQATYRQLGTPVSKPADPGKVEHAAAGQPA